MKADEMCKERMLKILAPLVIFWAALYIFRAGYETGQWLHQVLN